jgi:glucose dehydrogenase
VKFPLRYLATGILSYLAVRILEKLAEGLQGQIRRTEVYSIHGFSHVFFGIGLVSAVLFLRPKSSARLVMLVVLIAGIVWELHEGLWLRGEPLDSIEDVMLAMLSAYAFLSWERRDTAANTQLP